MLNVMRKHSGSLIIKIILGSIVVVFVLWGVGNFTDKKANQIAMVNGYSISIDKYREAYTNLTERFNQQRGGALTEDLKKILKRQALEQLINRTLLSHEAIKNNLRVSDDEVVSEIQKMPVFQTDGAFDGKRYQMMLTQLRMNTEQFEYMQRDAMLISKLNNLITNNVKISDKELRFWFDWNNTSVKIEYVKFEPGKYTNINTEEKEIKSYYDSNKDNYKTEPKVKALYLFFDPKSHQSKISITDDNIKEYFEANKKTYITPKTVEAKHILFKTEASDDAKKVEEIKNKAMDVYKMAKAGQDFAELAKKYSEDPGSKDTGGNLGAFKKEDMVEPFAKKAFSMKALEISEPVKTQFGWHLIKVEKVNEEIVPTLKDVESKIRQTIIEEKSKKMAAEESEIIYDLCYSGQDMSKVAKEKNLKILTSDYFAQDGKELLTIKSRDKFAQAAFKLEKMDISEVQNLEDGYYIIQLIEKSPSKIPGYNDVKERAKADLIKKKQDESANQAALNFLQDLKKGGKIDEESKKIGLSSIKTDFFKRDSQIPNIGNEPKISESAFKLSLKNTLIDAPVKVKDGYFVFVFLEKKLPSDDDFNKEKDQIKQSLLERKKTKTFESCLSQIKNKSKIEVEENML